MLPAIDLDEYFIDVEGVAVASMLSFQSAGVNRAEFDAPQAYSFAGYSNAPRSEEIFNITVAEIESIVEPDGVGNDIGRESVTLVSIHRPILPISAR